MQYLFSVIIPTLNEALFLPKLLADLTKQVEKNFEVIVVDGDSQDNTRDVIKHFEKILHIRLIHVKKRNLSYQRNKGGFEALGSYCVFIDADSRVNAFFLRHIALGIKKNPALIYLPTVVPQGSQYADRILFKLSNMFIDLSQNISNPLPSTGCMIFQTDFFKFIGGYREENKQNNKIFFPEDHDIMLRSKKMGVKAKMLKRAVLRFSLRRMKKEGRLEVIRKYIISSVQMTTKGEMNWGSFEYEMGGHVYKEGKNRADISYKNKIIAQMKNLLDEFMPA